MRKRVYRRTGFSSSQGMIALVRLPHLDLQLFSCRILIFRIVRFELNLAISHVQKPDPDDFVVRSLWDNVHI